MAVRSDWIFGTGVGVSPGGGITPVVYTTPVGERTLIKWISTLYIAAAAGEIFSLRLLESGGADYPVLWGGPTAGAGIYVQNMACFIVLRAGDQLGINMVAGKTRSITGVGAKLAV